MQIALLPLLPNRLIQPLLKPLTHLPSLPTSLAMSK